MPTSTSTLAPSLTSTQSLNSTPYTVDSKCGGIEDSVFACLFGTSIVFVFYAAARVSLCLFVLGISIRVPTDFLRQFTVTLFIPVAFSEFLRLVDELLNYSEQFPLSAHATGVLDSVQSVISQISAVAMGFAFHVFLTLSIFVYYGLLTAFLSPDGYKKTWVNTLLYCSTLLPICVTATHFILQRCGLRTSSAVVEYLAVVVLTCAGYFFFMVSVVKGCRVKQVRDTIIDDRHIIRKGKSRLFWFTVYFAVMSLVNVLEFVFAMLMLVGLTLPSVRKDAGYRYFMFDGYLPYACSVIDEFRAIALALSTLAFLPVYREAMFFCRHQALTYTSPVLDLITSQD